MSGPAPAGRERTAWVDVTKGVAILLVVWHHAVWWLASIDELPGVVLRADEQLASFRMPMFFFASGLFAGRTLAAGWRVVLRKRVALFAWVYLVWYAVLVLWTAVARTDLDEQGPLTWGGVLRGLVVPHGVLWFLYALAVYSVVARATRRVQPVVQVAVAAVVSALTAADVIPVEAYSWHTTLVCYVFFVAAVHHRDVAARLASRSTPAVAAGLALAYVGATYAVGHLVHGPKPLGVPLLLSCLGLAAAVALAARVATHPWAAPLAWLGERTLPVYVSHLVLIQAMGAVLEMAGWHAWSVGVVAATAALLVAASTAAALGLWRAARVMGAGWLYALPARWAYRPAAVGAAT